MKDITITASRLRKELIIFIVCFAAAFALNIYSIAKFETDWSEIIGQLHVVLGIALIIYAFVGIIRIIIIGISRLVQNSKGIK